MNFSPLLSHYFSLLLYCHYSPVAFPQAMYSVVLSPFVFLALALYLLNLLSSSYLSLHCSFRPLSLSSFSIPSVSLVILISIPFTIPVSLANSAVRHYTFQHPMHWKVKYSSIVSAHDFTHPDKAKSTNCGNGHTPSASLLSLAACKEPKCYSVDYHA